MEKALLRAYAFRWRVRSGLIFDLTRHGWERIRLPALSLGGLAHQSVGDRNKSVLMAKCFARIVMCFLLSWRTARAGAETGRDAPAAGAAETGGGNFVRVGGPADIGSLGVRNQGRLADISI